MRSLGRADGARSHGDHAHSARSDRKRTAGARSKSSLADGARSDARSYVLVAEGGRSDGGHSGGARADHRRTYGPRSHGGWADGVRSHGRLADVARSDSGYTDGARSDGRVADGARWDSRGAVATRSDAGRADGARPGRWGTDGARWNRRVADGARWDGRRADGARCDGSRTDGARSDGRRADGARSDGGRTNGARSDHRNTDSGRSDRRLTDGARSGGGRADGARSDGSHGNTARSDEHDLSVGKPSMKRKNRGRRGGGRRKKRQRERKKQRRDDEIADVLLGAGVPRKNAAGIDASDEGGDAAPCSKPAACGSDGNGAGVDALMDDPVETQTTPIAQEDSSDCDAGVLEAWGRSRNSDFRKRRDARVEEWAKTVSAATSGVLRDGNLQSKPAGSVRTGQRPVREACVVSVSDTCSEGIGARETAAAMERCASRATVRWPGLELLVGSPVVADLEPHARTLRAQYDERGRWLVEALALGDDSEDTKGLVLERCVVHATDQARAPIEAFHPVQWDNFLFEGARDGAIRMETYAIPGSRADRMWVDTPECHVSARRDSLHRRGRMSRCTFVADEVLKFLENYPGVAVITSGIGARGPVIWPPEMRVNFSGQPRLRADTHDCIKAAIVNAVFAVSDASAADLVQEFIDADPRIYTNMKPVGEVLQAAGESLTRCRVMRDAEVQQGIQRSCRLEPFKILAAKKRGVFVVRLRAVKGVDHAVVVDANNGLIIDSEESTALVLTAKVLQRCGGDRARDLRVTDVREIGLKKKKNICAAEKKMK